MKRCAFLLLLGLLASPGIHAAVINLTASLDGTQEVPPNAATGTGSATMTYDDGTNVLSWSLTYALGTGPATAAHFHGATNPGDPAGPGINSPVRIPIPGVATTSSGTVTGSFDLDDLVNAANNEENLLAGNWYINIHTQTFGGGEIRGQVLVPEPATFALLGLGLLGIAGIRRRLT